MVTNFTNDSYEINFPVNGREFLNIGNANFARGYNCARSRELFLTFQIEYENTVAERFDLYFNKGRESKINDVEIRRTKEIDRGCVNIKCIMQSECRFNVNISIDLSDRQEFPFLVEKRHF